VDGTLLDDLLYFENSGAIIIERGPLSVSARVRVL
jgi:hypothetical protein